MYIKIKGNIPVYCVPIGDKNDYNVQITKVVAQKLCKFLAVIDKIGRNAVMIGLVDDCNLWHLLKKNKLWNPYFILNTSVPKALLQHSCVHQQFF